jgi:alpha-maltose-1-phosphate synthase
MVILSHPTGNQNVRQALLTFERASLLARFYTTISWNSGWRLNALLPPRVRSELNRRAFPQIPGSKIHLDPLRAAASLLAQKIGIPRAEYLSFFKVCESLDRFTAKDVNRLKPKALYAYEGVALHSFREAKLQGVHCIYELPSGYWHYEVDLLREEAELRPEYAGTILKLKDPPGHNEQKDEELTIAEHIVVPSRHVVRTLKRASIAAEKLHVVPYGANESDAPVRALGTSKNRKLRVLFVGALTQRKGIGYLLDAVSKLGDRIELTLIGRRVGNSTALDEALRKHRWIPSAPHATILREMAAHDVLVLPSLSEGFALVISEALSRGLPVITTLNSGGEEIIQDGVQGFFVEIRNSEAIVAKLELLDRDRELLDFMSRSAVERAADFSWQRYRGLLLSTVQAVLN